MDIEKLKKELEGTFKNSLANFMENESNRYKEIILYGAGNYGRLMLKFFKRERISFFCDSDESKVGKFIEGIEIISPQDLKSKYKNRESKLAIIITSEFLKEIDDKLKSMNIVDDIYSYSYTMPYSIDSKEKFYNLLNNLNFEKIKKAYELLEDEKSKNIFINFLKHRLTGDNFYFKDYFEDNQYYPKGIIDINQEEVFIDGGAYNGDTIRQFISESKGNYRAIYAFEPGEKAFKSIINNAEYKEKSNIIIYNKGLYDENTVVKFKIFDSQEFGVANNINENGEISIDVVKLDDILKDKKVTFIKMDIEGSEMNALKGSKETIVNNTPKLAICVYHKIQDIWDIPIYINEINNNYRTYIRQHSYTTTETVLYAIPRLRDSN